MLYFASNTDNPGIVCIRSKLDNDTKAIEALLHIRDNREWKVFAIAAEDTTTFLNGLVAEDDTRVLGPLLSSNPPEAGKPSRYDDLPNSLLTDTSAAVQSKIDSDIKAFIDGRK